MNKKIVLILLLPFQITSIVVFISILPLLSIYCWVRYHLKHLLRIKPNLLFSPMALPRSYLTAQAVKTQGWRADVLVYNSNPIFDSLRYGFSLTRHPVLMKFMIMTDYLPLFVYMVVKYDIFEFSFHGGPLIRSKLRKLELILLKVLAKKIVVYGYGSDCLLFSEIKKTGKYNVGMDIEIDQVILDREKIIRQNIKRVQKYADTITASNDLVHLGKKSIILPSGLDLSMWQYLTPKKKKNITIIHSTNHRIYKGTRYIIAAIEELKKDGQPIELILVEGKTIKECQKIYRKGDIFIPNVITGWSGWTQLEAMAMGRPVVSYIKPEIAKFHSYYAKNCPIVSANPDNLKQVIKKLVGDFELRKNIGLQGIEYVHKYHSFEFVGKLRVIIYQKIWRGEKINQRIFEKELRKEKII